MEEHNDVIEENDAYLDGLLIDTADLDSSNG